jgi:hypothetical protein
MPFFLIALAVPTVAAFGMFVSKIFDPPDHDPRPVKDPTRYTMLERHVSFFQSKNFNSNYVTYSDFVTSLKELGVGPVKRRFVALVILIVGRSKTTTGSWSRPIVIDRVNVAKMIHSPADTGLYRADGSVDMQELEQRFVEMSRPAGGSFRIVTRESVFNYITTQRNNGKSPNIGQRGEYNVLFDVVEAKFEAGQRKTPFLTREDVTSLYTGTLLFELAGRRAPWQ